MTSYKIRKMTRAVSGKSISNTKDLNPINN